MLPLRVAVRLLNVMTNVVDFQAVDNLKVMVILLSMFDDILI